MYCVDAQFSEGFSVKSQEHAQICLFGYTKL
jgi:hypothetical protein